jgi:hypothetical protein
MQFSFQFGCRHLNGSAQLWGKVANVGSSRLHVCLHIFSEIWQCIVLGELRCLMQVVSFVFALECAKVQQRKLRQEQCCHATWTKGQTRQDSLHSEQTLYVEPCSRTSRNQIKDRVIDPLFVEFSRQSRQMQMLLLKPLCPRQTRDPESEGHSIAACRKSQGRPTWNNFE